MDVWEGQRGGGFVGAYRGPSPQFRAGHGSDHGADMGLRDAAKPDGNLPADPAEPEPGPDEQAARVGRAIPRSGNGEGSAAAGAGIASAEQTRGQNGA